MTWRSPVSAELRSSVLDPTPPHLQANGFRHPGAIRGLEHSQRIPDIPIDQLIAQNRERALAGDAEAAFQIAVGLWQCSRFNARERDIASQSPSSPFYASTLSSAEHWLERCEHIGAGDLAEMVPWIELAANQGSIPAMGLYRIATLDEMTATDMITNPQALIEYKRKTVQYLFAAANSGSIGAYRTLATDYANGIVLPKNPTLAYAYELVYYETGDKSALALHLLNMRGEGLSPVQKLEAQRVARQMLSRCRG